jgi:hypothetical protein
VLDKHRIPTNLTPTGDIIVPLVIPHDPQWTGLLLGVLITLEETEYYQKDPDFDDENAKVVAAQWRDRTINPLIEAIASGLSVITMRKFRLLNVDIGSNRTVAGGGAANVIDSDFTHTFDYPNAIIRCYGIGMSGSLAGSIISAQLDVTGELAEHRADAVTGGTAQRELVAVAQYSGLVTGVSRTISLIMSSSSGTGTMIANSRLLYEIEEWN